MKIAEFKHFTSFSAGSQVNLIKLRDNFFSKQNKIITIASTFYKNTYNFFSNQVRKQTHINFKVKNDKVNLH